MMKQKALMLLWVAFWTASITTLAVTFQLWMMPWYKPVLAVLAAISVGLGFLLLEKSGFSWLSIVAVTVGLLVGQWWFVEMAILIIGWSVGGFV
jgi:hypothetical protein